MFNLRSCRLKDWETAIISLQVISHIPALEVLSVYQSTNDELFSAVRKHSRRFADYALLPWLIRPPRLLSEGALSRG
jgi:hypothetical protein